MAKGGRLSQKNSEKHLWVPSLKLRQSNGATWFHHKKENEKCKHRSCFLQQEEGILTAPLDVRELNREEADALHWATRSRQWNLLDRDAYLTDRWPSDKCPAHRATWFFHYWDWKFQSAAPDQWVLKWFLHDGRAPQDNEQANGSFKPGKCKRFFEICFFIEILE